MKTLWRNYAVAWAVYTLIILVALKTESGAFTPINIGEVTRVYFTTLPGPLLLALLWPITGMLEKFNLKRSLFIIHLVGSILFVFALHIINLIFTALLPQLAIGNNRAITLWPILFNMMIYLLHAFLFHYVRAHQRHQEHEKKMAETQQLLLSTELNALRSKLNPHFLFNTLHSIIALVRKDQIAAEAALFHFSDMLRYILETEKSEDEWVLLDDELQFIRNYLDLEAIRLGNRLRVEWEVDSSALNKLIPALSLQPFVENSIKYAFNPRSSPGLLKIKINLDQKRELLHIRVEDDGPGCELLQLENSIGIGVRTIKKRLALAYDSSHTLSIKTAPNQGFLVSLSIPSTRI